MGMNLYLLFGFIVLVFSVALIGLIMTARMYASKDGERLRKRRM